MPRKFREPKPAEWVPTSDLADKYSLSTEFFTDRIGTVFERGVHVINFTPEAARPTYRWNLDEVHKWAAANEVAADFLSDDEKKSVA